ncbi:lysine--tRNA ligase [Buchnera aphidicola]|uniref:Lysine--tRNA ligase n=1 Tax=Buchnera aphidicola subsp. Cinara cedri (strain Cc) TaxID=372461 RepID=SYK_BUCCC|nr:lysine--tRNA ligase [Buchnera aphidicola]Q057G7.1 RecName: Full=Lysine--tRNA ligase; AltName: Full=Lysyl-tRNA synthetase; Short=LysRS [Buchnera aphidicola BCc]ABJ90732.1 lysyl-tRNA synthetase [Buchnera aphidicola BCc]
MSKTLKIIQKKKSLEKELYTRKKKLKKLKKLGFNFPNTFHYIHTIKEIKKLYNNYTKKELEKINYKTKISGRIVNKRTFGKALFFVIRNNNHDIQIYIKSNYFPKNYYQKNILELDLGDIIGVKGKIFKTNTCELSILCKKIYLLTKSLRSLPDKYFGLKNQEIKYRKRYLDLISNNKIIKIFQKRSLIISNIRSFMKQKKFLEVETPMLHPIPGGANAKPFITYHNSLNEKMYLRIAPELYLKKLIIGGFNKIFEINRNFRNEGISTKHNPEFTMMEIYMSYSNYIDIMNLLEELCIFLVKKISKSLIIMYKSKKINFKKPIKKMTMIESILKFNKNIDISNFKNIKNIKKTATNLNIKIDSNASLGEITNLIFEKTTEKKIIQPTFITEYPIEISPLAKEKNKYFAERFEFFIAGYEIANGFSELNDPEEQKKRFKLQISKKNYTDKSKNFSYDKDYIIALEHGLPPTSGLGVGIDRLIMILTNQKTIKDIIFFPLLKKI